MQNQCFLTLKGDKKLYKLAKDNWVNGTTNQTTKFRSQGFSEQNELTSNIILNNDYVSTPCPSHILFPEFPLLQESVRVEQSNLPRGVHNLADLATFFSKSGVQLR